MKYPALVGEKEIIVENIAQNIEIISCEQEEIKIIKENFPGNGVNGNNVENTKAMPRLLVVNTKT